MSRGELRHPLELDPLADSWTIEVPAEKWDQVIERFDDPPSPGEGSAKTDASYRLLFGWSPPARGRSTERGDEDAWVDDDPDHASARSRRAASSSS